MSLSLFLFIYFVYIYIYVCKARRASEAASKAQRAWVTMGFVTSLAQASGAAVRVRGSVPGRSPTASQCQAASGLETTR